MKPSERRPSNPHSTRVEAESAGCSLHRIYVGVLFMNWTANPTRFHRTVKRCAVMLVILSLLLYNGNQLRYVLKRHEYFGQMVAETHIPHIHLALLVNGQRHVAQFFTLLKSVLYLQGRHNRNSLACKLLVDTVSNEQCPSNQPPSYNPLELHLLADAQSRTAISSLLQQNNINGLILHYYSYHNYPQIEEFVRHVPAHPYFGSETILKITWPQFLPNGVKKVIALDTDLLFNQNVHDLWSIFEEFDDHQMIGGAFELTDNLQRDMATPEYPILETGINSGVLLLHLERMRKFNWSTASVELTKEIISSKKGLRYSDQPHSRSTNKTGLGRRWTGMRVTCPTPFNHCREVTSTRCLQHFPAQQSTLFLRASL